MTATIGAREPLSCAASDLPCHRHGREPEEWQLVDASHELRTPLTALRTEVELALLGNRDASELRAALKSAADEIRRVCRLADEILMLARADHGVLPLRLRPLEPRGLLEAAAARSRAAAATRGRQIVVRDTASGSWLLGDPDRAAQALDNLVSNALQYGSGAITLTAREDGELLGLHVADQGGGFADDIAERAFRRFTRGKGARGQGSGLGLSLVAAIAIAHRGAANICNLPEGGADACIALPRCLPEMPSAWQARALGDAGTVSREPEDARPAVASQPAVRQWAAAGHVVPCRRRGGNRRRPPGTRQTDRSTIRSPATGGPGPCPHCMALPATRAGTSRCRGMSAAPGRHRDRVLRLPVTWPLAGLPAGAVADLDGLEPGRAQPRPQVRPPQPTWQPLVVPFQGLPIGQHRAPARSQDPPDSWCGGKPR
jgi:Histidine kinase-, DNA gyrase B-, and HSP90-like ATPase/His Kinase A (phospho-acceptor) domain